MTSFLMLGFEAAQSTAHTPTKRQDVGRAGRVGLVQSRSIETGVHACAQLGARLVPCLSAVGISTTLLLFYYSRWTAPNGIRSEMTLELAVEWRRACNAPLLISPAIRQRAGELGEGKIRRCDALEQCRHDPG